MNRSELNTLDRLFREMYGKLLQYAYAVLEDVERSEDAVQETFQIAAQRIDAMLCCGNPQGWLVRTLKNVLREEQRREKREKKYRLTQAQESFEELAEEAAPSSDGDVFFELMYEGLVSEEDFTLLHMIYLERLSVREAAEALDINEEACKKRLQRARARMKAALKQDEQADGAAR